MDIHLKDRDIKKYLSKMERQVLTSIAIKVSTLAAQNPKPVIRMQGGKLIYRGNTNEV